MDGVPWELDQLPRGQHPNPVGDIFGSPPVRKARTRKSPKDKLDTISERPAAHTYSSYAQMMPPTQANALAQPVLMPRVPRKQYNGGAALQQQRSPPTQHKTPMQPHLRRDASTSTTDLAGVGGHGKDGGAEEGGKKVQKAQINTLAKLLSAMTGGNGRK